MRNNSRAPILLTQRGQRRGIGSFLFNGNDGARGGVMGFFDWFSPPKPAPVVIIRNVLGEEIDRVEGVRDLWGGVDLRGRQWAHAELSGMWLDGSDLTSANLFGARLKNTSRGAILRDAAYLRNQDRRR